MSRIFGTVTENYIDMPSLPVYEGYDAETGDIMAFTEAASDMVGIYEAMHDYGIAQLKAEVDPYSVTTEGLGEKAKNVFEKIKETLKKLWAKLRSFFDNVAIAFNSKVKNGKEFAKKYEDRLNKLELRGFKAETYPYTGLKTTPENSFTKCSDTITALIGRLNEPDDFSDHKEEFYETIRGAVFGDNKRRTSEEFVEDAVEKFRGDSYKKDLPINIRDVISVLKSTDSLKTVKDTKSNMDKSFSKILREVDDYEKDANKIIRDEEKKAEDKRNKAEIDKQNDLISYARHLSTMFTEAQSICTTYFNKWKEVYNERESEYKRICVKAFKYKED